MREVAVVSAVRSAVGKANKGTLKDTRPDDLLAAVLKSAVERAGIDAAEIDDVVVGTAMPEAEQGMNIARISAILAGIPDEVPALTINRFCSSGLQAIAQGATSIIAGWQKVVLAGGVESMSQIAMGGQKPSPNPTLMAERPEAYEPMGTTAENVAEQFSVSRADMDAFAVRSNALAIDAIEKGRFKDEIVPIDVKVFKGGKWVETTFDTDEGPRASTVEGLAKLRTPFKANGSVTAATSSQMSDGAAAVIIMDRATAEERGLNVLGVLRSFQVVGVPPEIMGVGPLYAIPKAVEAAGLTLDDIDIFEINEAFASQALYCVRELGIDVDKVNPNGGAIALGHPLGATGARMTATLLHEMKRKNVRYGIVSMCIGGGMGAAAVYENIHAD